MVLTVLLPPLLFWPLQHLVAFNDSPVAFTSVAKDVRFGIPPLNPSAIYLLLILLLKLFSMRNKLLSPSLMFDKAVVECYGQMEPLGFFTALNPEYKCDLCTLWLLPYQKYLEYVVLHFGVAELVTWCWLDISMCFKFSWALYGFMFRWVIVKANHSLFWVIVAWTRNAY